MEDLYVAGMKLKVIVVAFDGGATVLRIPENKAESAGLRKFDRRIDPQKNLPPQYNKNYNHKIKINPEKTKNETSTISSIWNNVVDLTPLPVQIIFIAIMTPALLVLGFLYIFYMFTSGIISAVVRGLFSVSEKNKSPEAAGNFSAALLFIYYLSNNQHVIYIFENPSDFFIGYILLSLLLIFISVVYIVIMLVVGSILGYALSSSAGRTILFLFIAFIILSGLSESFDSRGDCWFAVGRSGLICE